MHTGIWHVYTNSLDYLWILGQNGFQDRASPSTSLFHVLRVGHPISQVLRKVTAPALAWLAISGPRGGRKLN